MAKAQQILEESILRHGMRPVRYPAGPRLESFPKVLRAGRASAGDAPAFFWCNSDIILERDPGELVADGKVHGFHRTERPSGEVTYGIDMYLIPCAVWDAALSLDPPDLLLGASFVDWWITRAAQLQGNYLNHEGYIGHETHERSAAALDATDAAYEHNLRAYNRWAARAGAGLVDVPFSPRRILRRFLGWGY